MNYFIIKRSIFIVPSKECYEEFDKIDKFISILNKSNIGTLIEKVQKKNSQTANKSHKEITIHHSNGVNIADLYNYSKSNNYDLLALIKNTFTVEEVEIC